MSYLDWFKFFFTDICDATTFVQVTCFTLLCIIIDWPVKKGHKPLLIQACKGLAVYASYFVVLPVFFALDHISPQPLNSLIFSTSTILIPLIYLFIFLREDKLHMLLKVSIVVAGIVISNEMGKYFGLFIGKTFNDDFALVVLSRSFSTVLAVIPSLIIRLYDIRKYSNLPAPIVIITLITAFSLIAASIFDRVQNSFADNTAGICILLAFFYFILLVILCLSYFSLYYVVETRHKLTEAEIQASLTSAEKEAMKIDAVNREELSKLRHDLKNQFSYACILLEKGKTEEAKAFLTGLKDSKDTYLDSFSCSNGVVSSIINLELTKAKLSGVKLKVNVVIPPHLPFKDSDLCSLITNVLDNAIENDLDHEPIQVSIITQQDYLRISVINNIDPLKADKASLLKTTKILRKHGYGIKIIKNICAFYNGYPSFTVEDGKFICDIVLDMTSYKGKDDD